MRVLVTRTDRIGDLVLSLPVLHHLQRSGLKVDLLVDAYTEDLAIWAKFNGLCENYFLLNGNFGELNTKIENLLALFPDKRFKKLLNFSVKSFAPRTHLWTLFTFSKTFAQHRSKVLMSEMEYNIQMANWFLEKNNFKIPEFEGLKPLSIPVEFKFETQVNNFDVLVNVSNRGSAANWNLENYFKLAKDFLKQKKSVCFLTDHSTQLESHKDFKNLLENFSSQIFIQKPFERLGFLIYFLSLAKVVVSSSTGPLHIAHALGKDLIAIYPKTPKVQSFARWRPHGYWHSAPIQLIEI